MTRTLEEIDAALVALEAKVNIPGTVATIKADADEALLMLEGRLERRIHAVENVVLNAGGVFHRLSALEQEAEGVLSRDGRIVLAWLEANWHVLALTALSLAIGFIWGTLHSLGQL